METEAESAYVSCLEMIGEVDAESGPTPRPVKNTGQFRKAAGKRGHVWLVSKKEITWCIRVARCILGRGTSMYKAQIGF